MRRLVTQLASIREPFSSPCLRAQIATSSAVTTVKGDGRWECLAGQSSEEIGLKACAIRVDCRIVLLRRPSGPNRDPHSLSTSSSPEC